MGKRNCILWTINTNLYQSFGTQILSKSNTYRMFCRLFLKQNFHIYCFSPTEEAKAMFWHCNHQDLISVVHWALNCPFLSTQRIAKCLVIHREKSCLKKKIKLSVRHPQELLFFNLDWRWTLRKKILTFCDSVRETPLVSDDESLSGKLNIKAV